MKAGPKASVDDSPLLWLPRSTGSARFGKFCAPEGICGMLPRSSAIVEPIRFAARHSAPDTAAYARAAASASPSATTSGITTISQIRSMSGAESPVPVLSRGVRIRNPLW